MTLKPSESSTLEERERILKAGGFVRDHRVCGMSFFCIVWFMNISF